MPGERGQSFNIDMAPNVTLPLPVLGASTPEELCYAIIKSDKSHYSKQELLVLFGRLEQMMQPKFGENCSYIN